MPETITPEEYKRFLELAPKDVLKQIANGLLISLQNMPDDSPEIEVIDTMLLMLDDELRLREIEPLWRKAKRLTARNSAIVKEFTVRNSATIKEVGAIAACIGAGALVAGPAGALWGLAVATSEEKETSQTPIFNAMTADSNNAQSFYDKGLKEMRQKNYVAALAYFQKAIEKNPQDIFAHLYLGVAYSKLGRYQEAIESYKQTIRIKPNLADAHYNLSIAYSELGRYQDAIDACKQAISFEPNFTWAYSNLGRAYGNLGRWQEAIESYKQAIRLKPDNAEAYYNLGIAYFERDSYQEAIESYKQAIRVRPNYAEAHLHLGLTDLMVDDEGSALEEYKMLKTLDTELANKLFKFIYK
ncbi:MAG: tetratricopeptide repeat protein [Sedimentisphaerales bacterium]|jgi:Flp pilus assembly protein TadD